jgi:hypothetical protein
MTNLASYIQATGDEFFSGTEVVDSNHSWGMKRHSRKIPAFGELAFELIGGRCHWAAVMCFYKFISVLHFESLEPDNIKLPYYYVLAKEVVIFPF